MQEAVPIGILLGVIFIISQQMLIIFAISAERAENSEEDETIRRSQQALAVFCFFLFINYTLFGTTLAVFRDDVIAPGTIPYQLYSLCRVNLLIDHKLSHFFILLLHIHLFN